MIVIRKSGNGRYEVFAEDHHWEAFPGPLGAILTAQGLAMRLAPACGGQVTIETPWGSKQVSVPVQDSRQAQSETDYLLEHSLVT